MGRLITGAGYTGTIGGNITVYGTPERQTITVADVAGTVTFDPSFNKGGDTIVLAKSAASYTIAQSGSTVVFSDGDSRIVIPVGTVANTIQFSDGDRALVFSGNVKIGSQLVTTNPEPIGTPGTNKATLENDTSAIGARLILNSESAAVGGKVIVYGTTGVEEVSVLNGNVTLDASFNKGGDLIRLPEKANVFSSQKQGSSAIFSSDELRLAIPVGVTGTTLNFISDSRVLKYESGQFQIGGQNIGEALSPLTHKPMILGAAISANSPYNFNISPGDPTLPWWVQDDIGTDYVIKNIKDNGMSSVVLHFNYSHDPKTDTFFQPKFSEAGMYLQSPDWDVIDAGAQRAVRAGIKPVFYMTIIQLPYSWDSLLALNYVPKDPDSFFSSYKEKIIKIAELSAKYDSPYMSIGAELGPVATDAKYLPYWTDMIKSVREIYKGKLSYTSYVDDRYNYNTELDDLSFAHLIDLLGMTIFPQTLDNGQLDGTYTEFYAEWKNVIVPGLNSLIERLGKPTFIAEFGINRLDGTGSRGFWGDDNGLKLDFEEQAQLFDASLQAMYEGLDIDGIILWGAMDQVDLIDGMIDVTKSYTNNWIDVPAEQIISKWFSKYTDGIVFG